MPLSSEEIEAITRELEAPLQGARVLTLARRDDRSAVLTLRLPKPPAIEGTAAEPAEPTRPRRLFLLISARSGFARAHLVEEQVGASTASGGAFEWLRERLRKARILSIRQPGRGLAVEIDLQVRRETEGRVPDKRSAERRILVLELSSSKPNVVLLDARRHYLWSLLPVTNRASIQSGSAPRAALQPGETYAPPSPPPHPSAMAAVAAFPWRYLPRDDALGEGASFIERHFPLNLALGRSCDLAEAAALRDERRAELLRGLKTAASKRRLLLTRLEEDLGKAKEGEKSLRWGELLKSELPRLRRGMASVEVVDYYSPDLPRIEIRLDPARSPLENIERCFQLHRKAQRALPVIQARMEQIRGELVRIEDLAAAVPEEIAEGELRDIEGRAAPLLGRKPRAARDRKEGGGAEKARPADSPRGAGSDGPRRFLSLDGFQILVGRSAQENDRLTFRLARGNDLFFHVAGRPGAHVVVRTLPGRSVPLETLLDAAQLALYYSLPARDSAAVARGAAAEVDYVEVKHVRKPRGSKPGLVLLTRHGTLRARLEKERLERLRETGGQDVDDGSAAVRREQAEDRPRGR